ncbi:hypothetical protein JCM1840_004239 [Sporobolomyces johnsonii]
MALPTRLRSTLLRLRKSSPSAQPISESPPMSSLSSPTDKPLAASLATREDRAQSRSLADEQLAASRARDDLAQIISDEAAARALEEQFHRDAFAQRADDARLAEQLQAAEQRARAEEERLTQEALRKLKVEMIDDELRRANGVLECPVCCEEYFRGETMVQCPEGHFLCVRCAGEGAKAAFEQLDASLPCLADGSCTSSYLPYEARKFLDEAQWAQVEKLRREKDLSILHCEGLLQCPFCPYAIIIEDEDLEVLDCLNPDCAKRTCIKCKHIDHRPLPCVLANPTPVHRLEEEMSEALIRRCKKYLCQLVVDDIKYTHWERTGPCKGKLYKDDTVKQTIESVRQAGLATLQTEEERTHVRRLAVQ